MVRDLRASGPASASLDAVEAVESAAGALVLDDPAGLRVLRESGGRAQRTTLRTAASPTSRSRRGSAGTPATAACARPAARDRRQLRLASVERHDRRAHGVAARRRRRHGRLPNLTRVQVAESLGARRSWSHNATGAAPTLIGSMAGAPVGIPAVAVAQADGATIKAALAAGTATGGVHKSATHPGLRDGDLENGIVIHEYTHGISTARPAARP